LISESGNATAVSSMKDAALIRAQDMANSDLISHITHEGAYTDDILLTTHTGQDEIYIVTRDGKADGVAEIIRKLAADKVTKEIPENIPLFVFDERALSGGRVDLGLPRTKMITSSGIVGDPTLATPEKGTAVLTEAVNALCAILEDLRKVLASGKFQRECFDARA
jgi:hypothetical protein